ncbi:hypothetical protein [Luteimonas huabeiensis]|uniref:hypothetical protein n=1 Tax=Luteimonas huabeiensis TaxID=1244513 RepID=UPI000465BDA1|nr:hypothetical protein [Luteimonas huabeiensis]
MSTPTLPLALYKANLDLWLRISELLEENRSQWVALLAREIDDGAAQTGAEAAALRSGDWQALALLPGQALQRLVEHGVGDLQAAAQTALGNQMTFATGFQQALADWQQATASALGELGRVDLPGGLQEVFEQALQGWTALPDALAAFAGGGAGAGRGASGDARPPRPAPARQAPAAKRTSERADRPATATRRTAKKAAKRTTKQAATKRAAKPARKTAARTAKRPARKRGA